MQATIMLIGMGGLGGTLLEYLVTIPTLKFVTADIAEDRARARINLAKLGAAARDLDPQIDFLRLDLNDIDRTAQEISRICPDIILTTATLQTWWLPDLLPAAESARIKSAGFGVWYPVHFTLTLKLRRAAQQAGFRGFFVTAPYPDVANPVLSKLGMTPTCGIGNVEEVVPKIRWLAARHLELPLRRIKVTLVAHHALQSFTLNRTPVEEGNAPPFYLRVEADGRDVTEQIGAKDLLFSAFPITAGPASHVLTAATAQRLINALVGEKEQYIHVPGPNGLPGGYPVFASSGGIRLAEIPELTLSEAIQINEDSHRFDGIERIEADGTVRFTTQAAETIREALGYDCPFLPPDDIDDRARELVRRFSECANRQGVRLTQRE